MRVFLLGRSNIVLFDEIMFGSENQKQQQRPLLEVRQHTYKNRDATRYNRNVYDDQSSDTNILYPNPRSEIQTERIRKVSAF